MPDTALPSPSISSTGAPRMGTPANDTSWAGWAISSFTNKLSAASGEIKSSSNPATIANGDATQRPSSVPPPSTSQTAGVPPKPGMTLNKSSSNIPAIVSPDPAAAFQDEAEDFGDDWGGFDDPSSTSKKDKDEEEDPWGTPQITTTSSSTTAFDDKGEPDFAGWLAAQSAAKKPGKTPLPKGLAKGAAAKSTRPVIGGRSSTGGSAAKKVVVAPKKETPKAAETKSNEDEEEGWGDAW